MLERPLLELNNVPVKRDGFIIVGIIAVVAMVVCAAIAGNTDGRAVLMAAILGFATATIKGVLTILDKIESLEKKVDASKIKLDEIKEQTNGTNHH